MPVDKLHTLRMVIQQIAVRNPSYRLVVYGDWERPRHADFGTGQELARALDAALPDFATSGLSLDPLEEGQGSIAFTGEIQLRDWQLGLLGLA